MQKKICLVIPSLQAGGMERVMSELIGYFATKAEIEIHLILYGINRDIYYSIPSSVIIYIPEFQFNSDKRFISTVRTIIYLRKTIKEINADAVLSFGEYWNNFVLISTLWLKQRIFISDRSNPLKDLGRIQNLLRNILYKKAAGLIVQTEKAAQIAKKKSRNINTIVIGNPIRIVNSKNVERKNIVLTVGRLIKTKNLDRLIQNFVNVAVLDWKLVIVGDDAQKQENLEDLKELVKELNAESIVSFEGFQKNVDKYYSSSKIFAFTSSSEGFPNVIGEALANGLAVVSYNCVAGPSEMIIDDYNGYLVDTFNDSDFKKKISLLMNNSLLREEMSKNALISIKKFDRDIIAEKYLDFILDNNI